MVLDASLLNTQHYKVRIKGKVDQSREISSALSYTLVLSKREPSGNPQLRSPTLLYFCFLKSPRSLSISYSGTDSELCIYRLFLLSNLNFLHNSQWITFHTQSCLRLNSFCANLLHSHIDCFFSIATFPTFTVLLRLIYIFFSIACPYGVVLCCYK